MFNDDEDTTLITVPGWGDSGPGHWQSLWERGYPLSRRVVQDDWLYPERTLWVARLAETVADTPGRIVLAAHSLGCHTVVAWAAGLSLRAAARIRGALLVAPPALPIAEAAVRAAGELPEGAPLPAFAGFETAATTPLPFAATLVASRNDPFCPWAEAEGLARLWRAELEDAGEAGHISTAWGYGSWPAGQRLVQRYIL
ncbi:MULTISPECIES: alpha/beta hydrolase [Gulbenkiania]|uniref:Predicted esterase of the alpha/beta hydrolase fold n=1 Tax=Gulbenkiania indica TaxID=375574 RepID=A0A0K6GYE2_9NEIS|nr:MULTISPECIES: alpha/beta hydrolase [Gulbenkiania]CUA83772.1 Predicted esterase of the alpha/beta hydrolase fold [Gulbenkiania indica]